MQIKELMIALARIIGGIFSIATSSIATECYNSDMKGVDLRDQKRNNFNFIIINLVSAILVVLSGSAGVYFAAVS
jgi:hypothetical protein